MSRLDAPCCLSSLHVGTIFIDGRHHTASGRVICQFIFIAAASRRLPGPASMLYFCSQLIFDGELAILLTAGVQRLPTPPCRGQWRGFSTFVAASSSVSATLCARRCGSPRRFARGATRIIAIMPRPPFVISSREGLARAYFPCHYALLRVVGLAAATESSSARGLSLDASRWLSAIL